MAASVEKFKTSLVSTQPNQVVAKPQRDFLKEHRRYLKNMQESRKDLKTKNIKASSIELNSSQKQVADIRVLRETKRSAILTVSPPAKTRRLLNPEKSPDKQSTLIKSPKLIVNDNDGDKNVNNENVTASASTIICNQYVQTCDMEDESFLENVTFLEPSTYVLESIERERQPHDEAVQTSDTSLRLSNKMDSHLTNLKEFMDKGSVSKRKEIEAQRRLNFQKYMERRRFRDAHSSVPISRNSTLKSSGLLSNRITSIISPQQALATKKSSTEAGNDVILQNNKE